MIILNNNILQADYEVVGAWRGYDGANDEGNHLKIKIIVPEKFKDDLAALCEHSGLAELTPGMTIRMSLREALKVIPKRRARLDSYRQLISFLNDEMGINLTIHSQKSKKNG